MFKINIINKVFVVTAGALLSISAFAADYNIKISHSSPATNDRLQKSLEIFKENVEKRTNNDISISLYPASQLGGEREQLEGVQFGSIEMAVLAGPIPNIYPDAMVFDLPYLFKNREIAYKVMDGEFGEKILNGMLEKTGIRALAWGENGFRNFVNNVRPIKTPEDLSGLKIRTMENQAHIAMVDSFGATATPMAFSELYSSLQQGVIDGMENPISLIESMRFYEVQKYLTLDGHVYNPFTFIVNNSFFERLPVKYQKIIQEEAKNWSAVERKLNIEQENTGIEELKKQGMDIVYLSDEVKGKFRDTTKPVYDTYRKKLGDKLIDELMDAVAKAESGQ